jgi:phosphohistidine phosphatase
MSRQLYLLRHAKSDWASDAPNDFQRPLNDRGVRNARKMGKWMAEAGMLPETVISSSALRAWQTAALVCNGLGINETRIVFDADLYLADIDTLLRTIGNLPGTLSTAMLVGHNPGLDQMVMFLAGDELPTSADGKLMATATLAQFEIEGDWTTVADSAAQLVQVHRAR